MSAERVLLPWELVTRQPAVKQSRLSAPVPTEAKQDYL